MAKLSTHSRTRPLRRQSSPIANLNASTQTKLSYATRLIRVDPFRLMRAERAANRTASSRGKNFATRLRRVAT